MEGELRHTPFATCEQSIHLLVVDTLKILAVQKIVWYFLFRTAVTILHPPPAVSSLLLIIFAFKDTIPLAAINRQFLIADKKKLKTLVGLVLIRSVRALSSAKEYFHLLQLFIITSSSLHF